MQNLLSQHGDELRNENIIEVPAGKGNKFYRCTGYWRSCS